LIEQRAEALCLRLEDLAELEQALVAELPEADRFRFVQLSK